MIGIPRRHRGMPVAPDGPRRPVPIINLEVDRLARRHRRIAQLAALACFVIAAAALFGTANILGAW